MSTISIKGLFLIAHQFLDNHRTLIFIATSTVLAAWVYNKFWINGQRYKSIQTITGKTVLITGANTGIGYEAAKELLKLGARVVLACRNLNKGHEAMNTFIQAGLKKENIRVMECDLCSLESIRTFAKRYNEEEERLDVLICNAGLGWSSPILTKDGFNSVIQANYLGHFLLTNLLLDKLKKSRPSRIINVSSDLHKAAQSIDWSDAFTQLNATSWLGAYPLSKLFQILSTIKLKRDLYNTESINTFAVTPGWVTTSIQDPIQHHLGTLGLMIYYPLMCCMKFVFIKTPKSGAQTIIYCAAESKLERSEDVYFENCTVAKTSLLAIDQGLAERLWAASCEVLRI